MGTPSTRCMEVRIGDVVSSVADLSEGGRMIKRNAHGFSPRSLIIFT